MQPQIMLTLILEDHDRWRRQAAAEAAARLDRQAMREAAEAGREPGRRMPRPPLGPLARVHAVTRRLGFA